MTCVSCGGTGKSVVFACPGFRRIEVGCRSCDGKGEVTAETAGWKIAGEAIRRARIDRRESQGDAAKRLGIDTPRYSRIEFGLEPMPEGQS